MNYWPHSDKLLRAIATVKSKHNVYSVIYSGYDFDLLTDVCRQVCVHGLREGIYWYPPHKIENIMFDVVGWHGTFDEWEAKCVKEAQAFEKRKQQRSSIKKQKRKIEEITCTQCGAVIKEDGYADFLCPNCGATHAPNGKFLGNTFFVRGEGNEPKNG